MLLGALQRWYLRLTRYLSRSSGSNQVLGVRTQHLILFLATSFDITLC